MPLIRALLKIDPIPMQDTRTLLLEDNIISLRTAFVQDDGNLVSFCLMPAWLESSIPRKRSLAPKDFEWASQDLAWLYRHMRSASEETALMSGFPRMSQDVKPMVFQKSPEFKLIWTDSGNSVALFLNGEPWAFIDEQTRQGYSKGIIKPAEAYLTPAGNQWDQKLFEKTFETG